MLEVTSSNHRHKQKADCLGNRSPCLDHILLTDGTIPREDYMELVELVNFILGGDPIKYQTEISDIIVFLLLLLLVL